MQTFVAVCFVLVACAFAQQATPICTSDTDCNTWATTTTQRCEIPLLTPLNAICQARNTYSYRTTNNDPKGMCTGSINLANSNTNHRCGALSTAGCSVPDQYVDCIQSTKNFVSNKCDALNATTTQYRGEGERCNPSADPAIRCGNNLDCYLNVCRPQLRQGDNCKSSPISCGNGLVCDLDICVPQYSKIAQDPCHSGTACMMGLCTSGRCAETRSIPCYTNTDCTGSTDSLCFVAAGQSRGFCTNGAQYALSKWAACLRRDGSSISNKPLDTTSVCVPEYVKYICANQCAEREDRRNVQDGYVYNCQAGTRTKIADNTCEVKQTITACETAPISGAFSQVLSFVVVIVAAIMIIA